MNFADPFGLFACPPDCGFEGDPRNLEREVQMVQSRSPRDVAVMAGAVVVATAGSLGITAATAGMLLRVAPIAAAAGARIPFEGFQEWGRNVVQWGSRAGGALERAAEITAEQAGQLDPQKVRMAREFYQKAVEAGRGLPASEARVQLMDRILELQRTTKQ